MLDLVTNTAFPSELTATETASSVLLLPLYRLTHSWAPGLAAAGDAPAEDVRAARGARGAAPEALAPVTPTVVSATPAAAATNACVMYLCIRRSPLVPHPSRPVAARRPRLMPPARAYPHPRVLAHPARVPPGRLAPWCPVPPNYGHGRDGVSSPRPDAATSAVQSVPPSYDQRCLLRCPFLKLALIVHADG